MACIYDFYTDTFGFVSQFVPPGTKPKLMYISFIITYYNRIISYINYKYVWKKIKLGTHFRHSGCCYVHGTAHLKSRTLRQIRHICSRY